MGRIPDGPHSQKRNILHHAACTSASLVAAILMASYEPALMRDPGDLHTLTEEGGPTRKNAQTMSYLPVNVIPNPGPGTFFVASVSFAISILATPHDPRLDRNLQESILTLSILSSVLLCFVLLTQTQLSLSTLLCRVVPAGILVGLWAVSALEAIRKGRDGGEGDGEDEERNGKSSVVVEA